MDTEVYVASAQKNLLEERMKLCAYLWGHDFKVRCTFHCLHGIERMRVLFQTEMAFKRNPKILDQLQYCEKNQIELCVIVGGSELEAGIVKIRDILSREEVSLTLGCIS